MFIQWYNQDLLLWEEELMTWCESFTIGDDSFPNNFPMVNIIRQGSA